MSGSFLYTDIPDDIPSSNIDPFSQNPDGSVNLNLNHLEANTSNIGVSTLGITSIGFASITNSYTGIATIGFASIRDANIGVVTIGFASITNSYTGIATIGFASITDANIGVATIKDLYVTGILSAPNFNAGFALTSRDVIGGIGSINTLNVEGISTFKNGPVLVGSISTTGNENQLFQVTGQSYFSGNVGFGTTVATQLLDINGSIKLSNLIYDIDNQAGQTGWFLSRDASGVRWTQVAPGFGGGIIVLEEGNAVTGSPGIQTYNIINFVSGSGADDYELVDAEVNAYDAEQVDIVIKDFWTKTASNIYRNSRVGINTSNPLYDLDVFGSSRITNNLKIEGSTVSTSSTTGSLVVNGGAGIGGNLNVEQKLSVVGITTLFGFVKVDDDMIVTGFITGTISTSIYAGYANTSGISSYSDRSGIATYSDRSGIATYSDFSGIATYSDFSGIATYSDFSGIATYSDFSGIATYSDFSGIATYSDFSGIATYSDRSGIATYSDRSGIATYSDRSGIATYSDRSGIATYSDRSGIATYSDRSGIATYSDRSGIATYSDRSGIATYSDRSGIATYSDNTGISTNVKTFNTQDDQPYYLTFVENYTSQEQEKIRVDYGIRYNPDKNSLNLDGPLSIGGTSFFSGAVTLNSTLKVGGATTLSSTLQVGLGGTVITTTGIGSVGFGTNNPQQDIQFKEKDVFFDGGAIYDSNENLGFTSEQYQVPRNVLTSVGVDTAGNIISGRFFDAANLIRLNLDFIANETIGFITSTDYKNPAFTIVNSLGIATDPVNCKDDIKNILKAITYDITRGGNTKSVGAGLSYYNGNTLIHINTTTPAPNNYSVKDATIVAITTAAQIARYVINNVSLPKSYQSVGSSVPQIKDLTLDDDPNVGFNTDLNGCSNVVSAITVCAGIVTTIIGGGPSAAPKITEPDGKIIWAPAGADSKNIIYVSKYGNDDNNGRTEGAAKLTVGAAAAIAEPGDTIMIRSGVYYENNPIGLRTDVTVSGQDLRLVTIVPNNPNKDVFHVRRGCLIENLNFAGSNVSVDHSGCGAVAFPSTEPSDYSVTGYVAPGPADEGPSKRWRSPYVRNCTNFMTKSIGMKINGDHATASTIGADLKSMVCDSFTQYNEAGIGVSITNNGYAQLVSIFTINCDIGIYCDTGGSCDLTNSNSSFGNYGLVAVGLGKTEFTGKVLQDTIPEIDTVGITSIFDNLNNPRRPYDGQALWFKINLDNYPDTPNGIGTITSPLLELSSINVINGGSNFSATSPPNVIIRDADGTVDPKGPQGIIAEVSPTINDSGQIIAIDVISTGRNYLPTQNIVVDVDGDTSLATAVMSPIYYTVSAATEPSSSGLSTVTFNEIIPYELFENDPIELRRISRILTSSHSFEYIGTGTDINTATPLKGAVPIKANEVVAKDGAQIPFTSTDQKGNFDIGEGIQIDQTTNTIRGRDFSRAIQAEVTPLILALR